MSYTGWSLPPRDRARLLRKFPPRYADVLADHVTLTMKPVELPTATSGVIIGHLDDGRGVEALVVQIDGEHRRPDGKVYHITWSLDRASGRKPSDSNAALEEGWERTWPVYIELIPKVFD